VEIYRKGVKISEKYRLWANLDWFMGKTGIGQFLQEIELTGYWDIAQRDDVQFDHRLITRFSSDYSGWLACCGFGRNGKRFSVNLHDMQLFIMQLS